MANSYLQFSATIPNITDEEAEWLKEQLRGWESKDAEVDDEGFEEGFKLWCKERGLNPKTMVEKESWPDFGWAWDPNDAIDVKSLWIFAEEFGDIDNVVYVVQRFLKKFRPDDCFCMEWAEWCSSLRVGEFGGGAVLVTAKKTKWLSTSGWANQQRQKFLKNVLHQKSLKKARRTRKKR